MTSHERYEELIASLALGAMSADDQRELESHLPTCGRCQEHLADLRRVSVTLGLAVDPVAPPAALRARTLARAIGGASSKPAAGPVPFRPAVSKPPVWSSLATAAALVCIAGLGLYALSLRAQLGSTRDMLSEALERVDGLRQDLATARADHARLTSTLNVLRSGNVVRINLQGRERGARASALAYVSPGRGMLFSAQGLPGLAADRVYQLWVVPSGTGATPVSAGVFPVDQFGNSLVTVDLPESVASVAAVAVTEEPAGGSPKATTSPILVGTALNN